ncbi:MAG: winged helix-turn-helix domain-containing protein [Xanthomonadales bacterium]|nr:winged helix-turn-helix domain-containing protein [Xanthomonadales bacterium]
MGQDGKNGSELCGWRWGDYLLCAANHTIYLKGEPLALESRVYDLIALLIEHRDESLDKPVLIHALWGKRPVSDATLRQLAFKARQALGDNGHQQATIRTIYGRSLQWVAPLVAVADVDCERAAMASAQSEASAVATPSVSATSTRQRHALPHWLPGVVAVALCVALIALWMNRASVPEVAPQPQVAIEPFTNATGDASLDWIKHGLPGLLGTVVVQGGGLSVLGATQVAHVWGAKPSPSQSSDREAVLRRTLGAQVLVGGSLRKLATNMYELTVQVTPHVGYHTREMTLTGAKPARLAVDAARRVRSILLPQRPTSKLTSSLADKFVAEAYARGMDLVRQGKMSQARIYFELCARSAPDFLPAQLQLGESQLYSGKINQARKTLTELATAAQKRGDPGLTAQALNRLASVALAQQQFASALAAAQKALPFAQRGGDKKIEAVSAMRIVNAASRLGKLDLAGRQLTHARDLIERAGLKSLAPNLYNAESFYAMARGDLAGREAADRATLRFSEATGDETAALSARYNVAADLSAQGRGMQAIPLLHEVYVDARSAQNTNLAWYAGYTLVVQLLEGGADSQALALVDDLLPMADSTKQPTRYWMALALRAGIESYQDEPKLALATYRKAELLVDAKQSPTNAMLVLGSMAQAAYAAEPDALSRIARKADAIHAAQKDAASLAYAWQLVHALADAQAGRPTQSMTHMAAAASAAHPSDPQRTNLRSVAFLLATNDKAAAVALKGFDIAKCSNASTLHEYARWAQAQGNTAGQQRAQARIAALRKLTLAALPSGALATAHKPIATHG